MSKIIRFGDSKYECWSRVNLDNNDPIYISVAQTGIIIKKSNLGIFGSTLYKSPDVITAADLAQKLDANIEKYTTPSGITNPVLKALTQTALDSDTAANFCTKIASARDKK